LTLGQHLAAANTEVDLFDGRTETNRGVDAGTLLIGVARGAALTPNAYATWLAIVVGTELLRPRVGNTLEGTAVLVVGALAVFGAVREAGLVCARSASTRHALLSVGACSVEAGKQALAIDAKATVAALEVELATERRWSGLLLGGFFFERVETQAAACAGRSERALVLLVALRHATDGRADLIDAAIRLPETDRTLRRRLRVTFIPPADEASAVA
jgi:hypothetical protein